MTAFTARTIQFMIAGVFAALPATAGVITFTLSADGSGSLNGTAFSDELITFTQVTDTTAITAGCGYPCAPSVATNTVTIAGVGTETITGATYFFDNAINLVGITNAPGSAFLAAEDFSLGAYVMLTGFGPTAYPLYGGSGVLNESTSGGLLTVSSYSGEVTFQAVLGSDVPTPEPSSFGFTLLGIGAIAIVGFRGSTCRRWCRGVSHSGPGAV
jgi:hypothetical protein